MSILIKGMEMPTNCHSCPMCLMRFCQAGDIELSERETRPNAKRPEDCPIIHVPPHGNLIDRDALPTSRVEWEDIVNAPTIISAEDNTDFFTKGHLHLGHAKEDE